MITIDDILAISSEQDFERAALELFHFQAENCAPYRDFLTHIRIDARSIVRVSEIPFLPIEVFKEHRVYCGASEPEVTFTSSNTGGTKASCHHMAKLSIYEKTFFKAFEHFYGAAHQVHIYGLLPNYLQRQGSSLIYMVDRLIADGSRCGGFYLDDYQRLIADMTADPSPKILLGVSYALWDLAEAFSPKLQNTIVMETGGMKGQREELPKAEFHELLQNAFGVGKIHSEYGMAELTSQAYSKGDGLFETPAWMRVVTRDVNDPMCVHNPSRTKCASRPISASRPIVNDPTYTSNTLLMGNGQRGGVNIIDLANIYSCAFIQTQDIGMVYENGSFSILGRNDHSEIRGCNLLVQSGADQ